jgi:hypothetical protein
MFETYQRNTKIRHPDAGKEELWWMTSARTSIADGNGNLEVPRGLLLGIYRIGIPAT